MPRLSGTRNVILTDDKIAMEAMRLLKNDLVATKLVNRQHEKAFGKIGSVISVKKPSRIKSARGKTLVKQPMVDQTVALTVDTQIHVGLEFNSVDRSLSMTEFSERHLKSAVSQIAHDMDYAILQRAKNRLFNSSGTPGTAVNTTAFNYAHAKQKLLGHPSDGMTHNLLNPMDGAEIREQLKTLSNEDMVRSAIEQASVGVMGGANSYDTAQMVPHTVGDYDGSTLLVNGASQSGGTLVLDGAAASTAGLLVAGDVFNIAGVYSVNPRTYETTGQLQEFVVLEDADSDGAGNVTLTISPEINDGSLTTVDAEGTSVSLRAYQNVTELPADNAPITVYGAANTTYRQNLIMHRDAFSLAAIEIVKPSTATVAESVRDSQSGLSVCMTGAYSINEMEETFRLDVLFAHDALYPELGHRVWSRE